MAQLRNGGISMGNCGNCGYAQANEPIRCLRYPPRPMGATGRGQFPIVRPDQWCGEWASASTITRIISDREERMVRLP